MNTKILIDSQKCTLCGLCTKVCGSKTLEIIDNKVQQTMPQLCCLCGHCSAICNVDAITSVLDEKLNSFTTVEIDENLTQIEKILKLKRSVREFKNDELSKEVIENIINYAEKAPSSSNNRKREYFVITNKKQQFLLEQAVVNKFKSLKIILNPIIIGLIKLFSKKTGKNLQNILEDVNKLQSELAKGNFPIFRNAPAIVCFAAPSSDVQSKDDCVIAEQYMILYAQSQEIGSCVIGYAQYAHKALEKVLKVRKGYSIFAVATFGYQKFNYKKEIIFSKKPVVHWM